MRRVSLFSVFPPLDLLIYLLLVHMLSRFGLFGSSKDSMCTLCCSAVLLFCCSVSSDSCPQFRVFVFILLSVEPDPLYVLQRVREVVWCPTSNHLNNEQGDDVRNFTFPYFSGPLLATLFPELLDISTLHLIFSSICFIDGHIGTLPRGSRCAS